MDAFQPYAIHEPLRATEVVYDPGETAAIDIFAIHGLGSVPEKTWSYHYNTTKIDWLSDLLPQVRGLEDARIVMVNHQTRWDSNTADMELHDFASALLEHIENQHKAHPSRPIVFIAHSFGGLLLKKTLILAKSRSKDIAAMTQGIIFLGVPHHGTYAAFVGSCLSCTAFFRGSSSKLLESMAVDSPRILELESEFYDGYVLQHHRDHIQPYIFDVHEMRPERMGKLALGLITGHKYGLRHGRVAMLDTDHRGLNKFYSHDDPNFQIISRIISQAVMHARQTISITLASQNPNGDRNEIKKPLDILDNASRGIPWATKSPLGATLVNGLQEFISSWLAKDKDSYGNYLTQRMPSTALYGLATVYLDRALTWPIL